MRWVGLVVALLIAAASAAAADLQSSIFRLQDRALTALVNIQPITETFTQGEATKQASVGSGFLVDDEGHIVTNYHVVGRAKRVVVTLSDKERVEAELVGEDPLTDLAVIRIPKDVVKKHNLQPLQFGRSADLQVGQFVVALGSPLALARTATFGIVSNTERYLADGMSLPTGERTGKFNTWIQTDAAINPGNSGGPLVDLSGKVVGVNTRGAVFADNIGFSIPADTARRVTRSLIESGEVQRSYAGVRFQPLQDWAGLFDLEEGRGALVAAVEPGSPGEAAGVQAGDIVLQLGEHPLSVRFDEELPGLYQKIAETAVGSQLALQVLRRGSTEPLTLTLTTANTGRLSGDRFEAPTWGLAVKGITDQMVFDMDLIDKDGVFVEGVKTGGPAHRGGLNRGWVLGSVEGQPVHDLAGFRAIYEELGDGRPVLLTVGRYESQRYVLVKDERGDAP